MDHREADTEGRTIVGMTDKEGQLLVAVEPEADHAVLLNDTVGAGENRVVVARAYVSATAGIDTVIDEVQLVRGVDHVTEGEDDPRSTTHHVLFAASPASGEFDGLCDTKDWEFQWREKVPVEDGNGTGVLDEIRRFL